MAKKQFKIGEYAVGGIIEVVISDNDNLIHITARDYFTKDHVTSTVVPVVHIEAERNTDKFLNDLTTSYYADKIMTWIKTKVKFNNL